MLQTGFRQQFQKKGIGVLARSSNQGGYAKKKSMEISIPRTISWHFLSYINYLLREKICKTRVESIECTIVMLWPTLFSKFLLFIQSVFQSEIQGKIKPKGNLGTVDPGNQVSKDPGNRFMTELKLEQGIAGCLCFQYRNP